MWLAAFVYSQTCFSSHPYINSHLLMVTITVYSPLFLLYNNPLYNGHLRRTLVASCCHSRLLLDPPCFGPFESQHHLCKFSQKVFWSITLGPASLHQWYMLSRAESLLLTISCVVMSLIPKYPEFPEIRSR